MLLISVFSTTPLSESVIVKTLDAKSKTSPRALLAPLASNINNTLFSRNKKVFIAIKQNKNSRLLMTGFPLCAIVHIDRS